MPEVSQPEFAEEDYAKVGWFNQLFDFVRRRTNVVSVATTYSVASNAAWVRADATSAGFTITLDAANKWGGRPIGFIKIDASANVVTIAAAGTDTINGAASQTLAAQYSRMEIVSNGNTAWDIRFKQ